MKRFRPCGVYCNDDLVRADAGPSNPFRRTRSRRPAFRIDRTSPLLLTVFIPVIS